MTRTIGDSGHRDFRPFVNLHRTIVGKQNYKAPDSAVAGESGAESMPGMSETREPVSNGYINIRKHR